jgi:hypothetical protein
MSIGHVRMRQKASKMCLRRFLSLHALLREVEENLSTQTSPSRQANLKMIGDGCCHVLEELQSLVDKYESLGTQSKYRMVKVIEYVLRRLEKSLLYMRWMEQSFHRRAKLRH